MSDKKKTVHLDGISVLAHLSDGTICQLLLEKDTLTAIMDVISAKEGVLRVNEEPLGTLHTLPEPRKKLRN